MNRRHIVILAVVLAAGVLVGGIFLRLRGAGESERNGATSAAEDSVREALEATAAGRAFSARVAVPVEGALVRRDTFVLWVESQGRAAPLRATTLYAEVAGPVLGVAVEEGEAVREGELLVRIDTTEYALAVAEARAALERAEAEFRSMVLFDEEIADDSLRAVRRRQARIRSGLEEARVRLRQAALELRKTEVRAPYAGRVANLSVSPGARVERGDSLLAVLDLSRVEVEVEVLETEVPALEVGREAVARFAAFPGEEFPGRVVTVNPLVDRGTGAARVTVRLRNPEARILPGMHAEVRIAGRLHEDRVFVPREALVERDRRDVVFIFEPSEPGAETGRAKWRYVTTGLENEEYVEIAPSEETAGVRPGEVVLVRGHTTLTHDAAVRLENREALAGAAR